MAAIEPEQAALYHISINKESNVIYNQGVEFCIEKKLRVEASCLVVVGVDFGGLGELFDFALGQ
jgi:hypothetical protein